MNKKPIMPTKVIDDFFEIPSVWRHFALQQTYSADPAYATWAGVRTAPLDELDTKLFHSFASKLIVHLAGFSYFKSLKVNFASVDGSFGQGWVHDDEPIWNVAGIIYLNPEPPPNSGTLFFTKIQDSDQQFNNIFFEELKAAPDDRKAYQKYKDEQRALYRKNMTVGNVYNRCLLFNPALWHSADNYFGDTLENSRLTITFFGLAA